MPSDWLLPRTRGEALARTRAQLLFAQSDSADLGPRSSQKQHSGEGVRVVLGRVERAFRRVGGRVLRRRVDWLLSGW